MRRYIAILAVIALAMAALKAATDLVAAAASLVTLGVLAASLLGIPRRPWIGFALLGWGYLGVALYCPDDLPTPALMDQAYPHFGRECVAGLDEELGMPFPEGAPLNEVLAYIKWCSGIQFHIDADALERADRTMSSEVVINLHDVPLRTTLALSLEQLGLTYRVREGFILVTDDARPRAFHRIGHCCFALLAACAGAAVGRLIDRKEQRC